MATKKKTDEARTKAAVGRERRLALALRAVLDQGVHDSAEHGTAEEDAESLLDELGYSNLEAIPTVIKRLTAELATASQAGEWGRVSELAQQLERAKAGLPLTRAKGGKVAAADA